MDQLDEAAYRTGQSKNFLKSQDRRDAFYKREVEAYKKLPKHIRDRVPEPLKPKEIMLRNGHVDHMLYGLMPGIAPEDVSRAEEIRNNFLAQNREKHWRTQKLEASARERKRKSDERKDKRQNHIVAGLGRPGDFPHKTMLAEHVTSAHVLYNTLRHQQAYAKEMQALLREHQKEQPAHERAHVPRVEILSDEDAGEDKGKDDDAGAPQKKQCRAQVFEDGFVLFTEINDDDGDGAALLHADADDEDNTNSPPRSVADMFSVSASVSMVQMDDDDEATRPAAAATSLSSSSSSHELFGGKRVAVTGKKKKRTADRRNAAAIVEDMLMMDEEAEF